MWVDGCGLTLDQLLVDGKTNEIAAVPKLLRLLDIKGATVSLDAMGCQKKIAQEIHFGGGHYLLALKANQGTLHDDVRSLFNDADALAYGRKKKKGHQVDHHDTGPEKSHGRIE